jgi:hypothetical protein
VKRASGVQSGFSPIQQYQLLIEFVLCFDVLACEERTSLPAKPLLKWIHQRRNVSYLIGVTIGTRCQVCSSLRRRPLFPCVYSFTQMPQIAQLVLKETNAALLIGIGL